MSLRGRFGQFGFTTSSCILARSKQELRAVLFGPLLGYVLLGQKTSSMTNTECCIQTFSLHSLWSLPWQSSSSNSAGHPIWRLHPTGTKPILARTPTQPQTGQQLVRTPNSSPQCDGLHSIQHISPKLESSAVISWYYSLLRSRYSQTWVASKMDVRTTIVNRAIAACKGILISVSNVYKLAQIQYFDLHMHHLKIIATCTQGARTCMQMTPPGFDAGLETE